MPRVPRVVRRSLTARNDDRAQMSLAPDGVRWTLHRNPAFRYTGAFAYFSCFHKLIWRHREGTQCIFFVAGPAYVSTSSSLSVFFCSHISFCIRQADKHRCFTTLTGNFLWKWKPWPNDFHFVIKSYYKSPDPKKQFHYIILPSISSYFYYSFRYEKMFNLQFFSEQRVLRFKLEPTNWLPSVRRPPPW